MNKLVVIKGLVLVIVSIILGAFAAHYLQTKLSVKELTSFQVGVRYQTYGGIILLLLGFNYKFLLKAKTAINMFFIGNVLFSISIYYLALTDKTSLDKLMGPVTPLGGLLMIIGLTILLFRVIKSK